MVGLPLPGYMTLGVVPLLLILFYLSRFKKKYIVASIIYVLFSYILIGVSFFYNSGIDSPITLLFTLSLMMIVVVTPRKHHPFWVLLHLLFVANLYLINYYYPQWVPNTYSDTASRYLDHFVSFVFCIVFIYIVVIYLRNNYSMERKLAESRARALEKSSKTILLQNETLKEINTEKDKLFSIISHDLRSPLSSIQSYLEIINQSDITDKERTGIEKELLELTKSTHNMLNNLLQWSSKKLKHDQAILQKVDVIQAMDETLKQVKPFAKTKNIHLVSNPLSTNLSAQADYDMLLMVLRNLMNNAIKFTPHGGEVSISSSKKENKAIIKVKDNGVGISDDKKNSIFTFKISSAQGTNNEIGTGLGLVLCHDFIEAMKGSISFESQVGKGSEFTVKLTLA